MELDNINKSKTMKEYIDFCVNIVNILKKENIDYKLVGDEMICYPDDYCDTAELSRYITLYELDDDNKILRFNDSLEIKNESILIDTLKSIKNNTLENNEWNICTNTQSFNSFDH